MTFASNIAARLDLSGKTIVISGASSGLGAQTARALATTGANIVITARNLEAGQSVIADLRAAGGGRHVLLPLDLSHPDDVLRFSAEVAGEFPEIDVLVANAGIAQTPEDRLENGFDLRFATNYLGHFLLVHALLEPLSKRGSRLVMLGSAGHKGRPVNLEDMAWREREIDQRAAYGESKSAVSLFAVEATRRWHARGIFANCVLPGSAVTGLQRHYTAERLAEMIRIGGGSGPDSVWRSAEQGAETIVWASIAPELERVGGLVLEDGRPCQISGPNTHRFRGFELHSTDSDTARKLWQATLALIRQSGIAFAGEYPVR